jgi:hypothetical protein
MREPAPQWVYTACGHIIDVLWPDIEFPEIHIFMEDGLKYNGLEVGGLMLSADIGGVAEMTLNKCLLAADFDFVDAISIIAHELGHLVVHLADANEDDDHGQNFRYVMDEVGLHVVPGAVRETVVDGGPFWVALQSLMPVLLAEGYAPAAKEWGSEAPTQPARSRLPALRTASPSGRAPSLWDAQSFSEMPGFFEPRLPPGSSVLDRIINGNPFAGFK